VPPRTDLCTPGKTISLNNADIRVTTVERTKFQNILQSLGAHDVCYEYLRISVEANIMEPSRREMEAPSSTPRLRHMPLTPPSSAHRVGMRLTDRALSLCT